MKLRALVAAGLLVLASTNVMADFARVGPVDVPSPAGNGFPKWYQDLNGLVLDLCMPNATDPSALQQTACLLGPPNPPYVFPTNFPDEAFYFRATAGVDTAAGKRAVLVLALEAAFANGGVASGDQMVFSRIRVTAGVPFPGTYTVIHPWGDEKFIVDQVGPGNRDIIFTEDIGITPGQFTAALRGRAGPFLTRDVPAGADKFLTINGAQFLSDGVATEKVTGSRFGTNFFRICGPFTGAGAQDTCVETDQFTLTGRVHDLVANPIASPLTVERATYNRSPGVTRIDVSASALPGIGQATPVLSAGAVGMPPVRMSGPTPLGFYYGQGIPVPPETVPGLVSVINSGDNPPSMATRNIVDEVFIASAVYNPGTGTLTVIATSSDKGWQDATTNVPPPALQLDGFPTSVASKVGSAIAGDVASVQFDVTGLAVPPPAIDVVSSAGGVGRLDITMVANLDPFPPGVPLARDDVASATAGGASVPIAVTANDIANAAAPITLPVTPAILAPGLSPAIGSLTANADGTVTFTPTTSTGTATFRYTVTNTVGQSNPATVTIDVVPGAGGPIPVATNDPSTGSINVVLGQSVTIDVLGNDNGNGAALVPGSVRIALPPSRGTAVANTANGTITYTAPNDGIVAPVTFTYNVANTAGNTSNDALVTVNVVAPETVTVGTARCSNGPKWDLRGTASLSTSVTLFLTATVPDVPTTGQILATVPVDALGAWRYSQSGGAACRSPISLKSSLGTKRENIPVQLR